MENFFQETKKIILHELCIGLTSLNSYKIEFYIEEIKTSIYFYPYVSKNLFSLALNQPESRKRRFFDSSKISWRASRCTKKKKKKRKGCRKSNTWNFVAQDVAIHRRTVISSVADCSRIQRSLSPFREAKRVPCPFLPLSLFLYTIHTRFTPSLSVLRFVVNGHREWTRRKGIHFVPFDGDETQTRPYLFLSFSFFLFRRYLSFLYFHDFESQQ